MTNTLLLAMLVALALAVNPTGDPEHFNFAINREVVDTIRKSNPTWTAYEPGENPLRNYTDADLKTLTSMPGVDADAYFAELDSVRKHLIVGGGKKDINGGARAAININNQPAKSTVTIPTAFDWRTTTDGTRCMPSVTSQGTCGGCYAFAVAEVFAARYCQAVSTATSVNYSPEDLLSCGLRTMACSGGVLDVAFHYVEEYGLTTLACKPFAESATGDSATTTQSCTPTSCSSGSSASFVKKFCKKGTSVILYGTDRMEYEIMTHGPLATYITVYSDLTNYKSGVYSFTSGTKVGLHAVVLVGWGVSGSVNYWIVMNSWGADWGESGYFRISMSDTTSNVGSAGYYCVPDT